MRFDVGDQVRLHPGGMSVFTVIEVDHDGDPDRVLIQSVLTTAPGSYPWPARTTTMVRADLAQ